LVLIGLFFAARIVINFEHEEDLLAFKAERLESASAPVAAPSPLPTIAAPSSPDVAAELREPVTNATWAQTPPASAAPNQAVLVEPLGRAPPAALEPVADARRPIEGVLRVPTLGLEVVVYYGTDNQTLDRGAGRIEGTAPLGSSGNVGVAAHRDGFFRPLKDIEVGDEIFVDLASGTLRYEVASTLIVAPEDVWVLAPAAEPTLTLVTCYPFYFVGAAPQRFIVRATASSPGTEPKETPARLL
jgi:LPXTG-site transpeptidase (sortase) family protein